MSTIEEQLFETRKAVILEKLKDQPASIQQSAIRNLKYMQFDSAADFNTWANEAAPSESQDNSQQQPSEEQLDSIMDHMGLGRQRSSVDKVAPAKDSIDEIIDNMF
jgi:hypothetical protein